MVTTFYPNLGQFALTSPTRFLLLLLDLSSSGCDDVYFGLNFFGRKHDCNFFPFSFLLSLTNDQDSINLNNPPNLEEEARQCGVVGGWQMGQVGSNRDEERKKGGDPHKQHATKETAGCCCCCCFDVHEINSIPVESRDRRPFLTRKR